MCVCEVETDFESLSLTLLISFETASFSYSDLRLSTGLRIAAWMA